MPMQGSHTHSTHCRALPCNLAGYCNRLVACHGSQRAPVGLRSLPSQSSPSPRTPRCCVSGSRREQLSQADCHPSSSRRTALAQGLALAAALLLPGGRAFAAEPFLDQAAGLKVPSAAAGAAAIARARARAIAAVGGKPPDSNEEDATAADAGSLPDQLPAPAPPTAYTYSFSTEEVPSNLLVKQYWSLLQRLRPKAWSSIALHISEAEYDLLIDALDTGPMASLRTAALYLPWALLQLDAFAAAIDVRKAYSDFDEHVEDLHRVAEQAEAKEASPLQVQQAFLLMSASLDVLLRFIPAQYLA